MSDSKDKLGETQGDAPRRRPAEQTVNESPDVPIDVPAGMPIDTPSDNEALEEYLRRESELSRRYRELEDIATPAHLDGRVLAQARAAVQPGSPAPKLSDGLEALPRASRRARPAWVRWSAPVALAASVVLVFSILLDGGMQQQATVLSGPQVTAISPPEELAASASAPSVEPPPPPRIEQRREAPDAAKARPTDPAGAREDDATVRARSALPEAPAGFLSDAEPAIEPPPRVPESAVESAPPRTSPSPTLVVQKIRSAQEQEQAHEKAQVSAERQSFVAPGRQLVPASSRRIAVPPPAPSTAADTALPTARARPAGPGDPRGEAGERPAVDEKAEANAAAEARTDAQAQAQADRVRLPTDPERWLDSIRTLRRQGKAEEADREWLRFLAAFPEYPVAPDDPARRKQ